MSVVTRLPRKPSALIRMAVDDLEKLERTPGFKVDMTVFVDKGEEGEGEPCLVCLAGAVMVCRLDGLNVPGTLKGLRPCDFPDNEAELNALDAFRNGDVDEGCYCLYLAAPESYWELTVPHPYEDGPMQFKADIRKLADELEDRGL